MSGKRKRIVLSLGEKVKILERLKNGEAGTKLSVVYGVGKSTISEIKKNRDSIINFTTAFESEEGSLKRKSMKRSYDDEVDKALYVWFLQKRSSGHPISGPLLKCEGFSIVTISLKMSVQLSELESVSTGSDNRRSTVTIQL